MGFLVQTCQPLIKEKLETYEKNQRILQKVVRFHLFFLDQDKTNPFSIGGISSLFKNYLLFNLWSLLQPDANFSLMTLTGQG